MKKKILVAGASGTVGREVVVELLKMGQDVVVLTRDKEKCSFPTQVEIVEGDLSIPETMAGVFTDVSTVHLIAFSGETYTPLNSGYKLVEMMEAENVERVTVLWNGEGKSGTIEKAVMNSQVEWTILQPQEYMANATGWAKDIRERRTIEEPCIDRPTAAVHENDLGAVIARILVYGGHAGKVYTLTGPEVLSPRKQGFAIADAIGADIRIQELSEAEARNRWATWGLEQETMDYLYTWYKNPPLEGYTVNQGVATILGRPPKTFHDWIMDNIQLFVSSSPTTPTGKTNDKR